MALQGRSHLHSCAFQTACGSKGLYQPRVARRPRTLRACAAAADAHGAPLDSSSGSSAASSSSSAAANVGRRALLQAAATVGGAAALQAVAAASSLAEVGAPAAPKFLTTASGLKIEDVRVGEGATPKPGDRVAVHWSGYTKGYQGKRIGNTTVKDTPYEFVVGSGQAIAAFDEAVLSMKAGGIRRVEIPGAKQELGYSLSRSERFTDELISPDLKIFKYRKGPQPDELGGQRALDFVLDNSTLQDFNRDLLFDIKLLSVYPARR